MNESWPQREPQEEIVPQTESTKNESNKKNWLKRTAVAASFLVGGMLANQEAHSQNPDLPKAWKSQTKETNNPGAAKEFSKLYVEASWNERNGQFLSKVKFEKNVNLGEEIKFEYTLLDRDEKEIEKIEHVVGEIESPEEAEITISRKILKQPTGYYFMVYKRNSSGGDWKPVGQKVFHICM
jgi:hypothetical protein